MKVAAYLRVSTSEQTTGNQLPAIKVWCDSREHDLVEVYTENESAWRIGHQRELSRLLTDLRSGRRKYGILLVWSLDRLTRQGIGAIFQLIDSFKRYGCQVVSISEPWTEQTGPMADLLYAVVAWVAKFESDRRSERVKAGLARAKEAGQVLGRPVGSKDKKPRRIAGYLYRWKVNKQG